LRYEISEFVNMNNNIFKNIKYTQQPPLEPFQGDRGEKFQKLIIALLKRGCVKKNHIDILTNKENMEIYNKAFTAASFDADANYEMYEQLGDVTANKFIVWYMYRRFPQLKCPQGVKVVARLRINYGARQSFSDLGEKLGFWDFISSSGEDRCRKKKDLLEDCVESFIGVTEWLIDDFTRPGIGQAVVYDILKNVFDEMPISLKYESLYDSKTRLKELFDFNKAQWGSLVYKSTRNDETGMFTSVVSENNNDRMNLLGNGSATKQKDAEQKAAEMAIKNLAKKGHIKPVPTEYALFDNC